MEKNIYLDVYKVLLIKRKELGGDFFDNQSKDSSKKIFEELKDDDLNISVLQNLSNFIKQEMKR